VEAFPRLAAVEGGYRGHDGVRRWWEQLLGAFPDFHAEILEVRDLGEFMVVDLRVRGRGAESDTPLDTAIWHVNQFRDGKVIRWRVYTSRRGGCGRTLQPLPRTDVQVSGDRRPKEHVL
jgi:hypothetical protein